MSEIKVGDRVAVYSIDGRKEAIFKCHHPHYDNVLVLFIEEYGHPIETLYAHIKQCRKIVKVKKCSKCNGKGFYLFSYAYQLDEEAEKRECNKCKGKGKVKV